MSDTEWTRPQRDALDDKERAYLASAKRKDRHLDDRIQSALQASEIHYERTGRCLNITRDIVDKGLAFVQLDEEEDFFNPELLLPKGIVRDELWQAHLKAVYCDSEDEHSPPLTNTQHNPATGSCPLYYSFPNAPAESSQSSMGANQSSIPNGMYGFSTLYSAITFYPTSQLPFYPDVSSVIPATSKTQVIENKELNVSINEDDTVAQNGVAEEFDFDEWLK